MTMKINGQSSDQVYNDIKKFGHGQVNATTIREYGQKLVHSVKDQSLGSQDPNFQKGYLLQGMANFLDVAASRSGQDYSTMSRTPIRETGFDKLAQIMDSSTNLPIVLGFEYPTKTRDQTPTFATVMGKQTLQEAKEEFQARLDTKDDMESYLGYPSQDGNLTLAEANDGGGPIYDNMGLLIGPQVRWDSSTGYIDFSQQGAIPPVTPQNAEPFKAVTRQVYGQ